MIDVKSIAIVVPAVIAAVSSVRSGALSAAHFADVYGVKSIAIAPLAALAAPLSVRGGASAHVEDA